MTGPLQKEVSTTLDGSSFEEVRRRVLRRDNWAVSSAGQGKTWKFIISNTEATQERTANIISLRFVTIATAGFMGVENARRPSQHFAAP